MLMNLPQVMIPYARRVGCKGNAGTWTNNRSHWSDSGLDCRTLLTSDDCLLESGCDWIIEPNGSSSCKGDNLLPKALPGDTGVVNCAPGYRQNCTLSFF